MNSDAKLELLKDILKKMESVVIAFSGGVDSTFLSSVANEVLGQKALTVFGHSSVCPPGDLEEALYLAQKLGFRFRIVETRELDDPKFVANTPDRCYYCKQELFGNLKNIASSEGIKWTLDGSNYDDVKDYRPGRKAGKELGVRSPLCEVQLTKEEIRQLSLKWGLATWDKPASPCLASRIPYGIAVSEDILRKIAQGEEHLRKLGIRQLRLRHHGDIARIEVEAKDMALLLDENIRSKIVKNIKDLGYSYVTLDLNGYHPGSLNIKINRIEGE